MLMRDVSITIICIRSQVLDSNKYPGFYYLDNQDNK